MQLDGTLASLRRHCRSAEGLRVAVLYTTSSASQAWMYRIVAFEHPEVEFIRERSFKRDLIDLARDSRHVLFLVDDTVVVRDFDLARARAVLDERPSALGFSLRLGRNTIYCYSQDRPQALPEFDRIKAGILEFRWSSSEADFGYPLEVSSSLFRTSDVGPLLERLDYRNPNTLESELARHAVQFADTKDRLLCFDSSAAFSIPVNLVQDAWKNRISDARETSVDALAERYSRGERLAVSTYDDFAPLGCHQEVELAFEKRAEVPTVSVVIPCFNQAAFLTEAVESVLAQTFSDWEVVIVDDGSPDETADVATRLIEGSPGQRIRMIRQANVGLAGARNAGIAAALGRYILPLDADDLLGPSMLRRMVDLLESDRTISIVYSDYELFGARSGPVQTGSWSTDSMCEANQFAYCSLYRRDVWEAVGGYNPNMVTGYEDWDFWIGAVRRGFGARRIREPLFRYRVRPDGMLARAKLQDAVLRAQLRTNHPALFTYRLRLFRAGRAWGRLLVSRIRRLLPVGR